MAFGDVVHTANANNGAAGTGTLAATIASSGQATAGNLLVAFLRVSSSSCNVLVSDNIGGAWTSERTTDKSTSNRLRRWTRLAAGGETTFTLDPNGTSVSRTIIVVEIAGPFVASYLDASSDANATATSLPTGTTGTTTQNDEIAVAAVMLNGAPGGAFSFDSGFTVALDDGVRGAVATKLLSTTGTTGTTASWTSTQLACAQVATYKKDTAVVAGSGWGLVS